MRVLMTTDTVGGVWTYTRELTEGLLERGCSVTLMSMGRLPTGEQAAWAEEVESRWGSRFGYQPTEFPLEWMQGGEDCYERSAEAVMRCARMCGADLLHANQFCYGALPLTVPKIVVAHSDVWSWYRACRGGALERSSWSEAYWKTVLQGLEGADSVVTATAWMGEELQTIYGYASEPRVIANGVRPLPIQGGARRQQAITCGRLWDEGKNIGILAEVEEAMPILVAGETEFDGARAGAKGLRMLGSLSREELARRFEESVIYVATSRYEPFGLAPVEAALAGCAVVANDIPSLREVWGDAATYFDRNCARSLSTVLRELAEDEGRLQVRARAARERATRYTPERMTEGYLALYGDLLAGRMHRDVA